MGLGLSVAFRFVVPLIFLAGCGHSSLSPHAASTVDGSRSTAREGKRLGAAIDAYTEARKRLDPFSAAYYDVEEDLDQFGDYPGPAYLARKKAIYAEAVARVRDVRPALLDARDARTYRLFKDDVETGLRGCDFPSELLDFNQMGNRLLRYMDDSNPALTQFPFDSVRHYDAFVKRANGFPAYVDRQIALFRRGIDENVVQNCVIVEEMLGTYAPVLEPAVEKNPFWRPVTKMPVAFSAAERARVEASFRTMIRERIVPGYRSLDRFLRDEYHAHCRRDFGIGTLPHGAEWYAYLIRAATDLPLDAREVHETGLREVARIRGEMDAIRKESGFKGPLRAFVARWMRAPDHYFPNAPALFAAFQQVKDEMALVSPRFFSRRPTSDYEIVASSNPHDAAASYFEPTENVPHGRLVINTMNLRAVPRDRVRTLSLHEAVPGHHFQLALAFEMKDRLSEYQRKVFGSTAFAEGWALYAERLGREMGVYRTPMQRLGNLNDEMLRAVRLVVDTGIHAYGWSRDRAIAFMAANLANDRRDVEIEVDRYAVWPGQALAYKIGELEILALRQKAETTLGPAFDLEEFHETVLGNGTVSLGVLRQQVDDWLAAKQAGQRSHPG